MYVPLCAEAAEGEICDQRDGSKNETNSILIGCGSLGRITMLKFGGGCVMLAQLRYIND